MVIKRSRLGLLAEISFKLGCGVGGRKSKVADARDQDKCSTEGLAVSAFDVISRLPDTWNSGLVVSELVLETNYRQNTATLAKVGSYLSRSFWRRFPSKTCSSIHADRTAQAPFLSLQTPSRVSSSVELKPRLLVSNL